MDVLIKRPRLFSRQDGMIQVWRLPETKILRAHLFGLTLALVGVFFTIILDYAVLFQGWPWYTPPLAIGIFILCTYLEGLFVILTGIAFVLSIKQLHVLPQYLSPVAWYFAFYLIGAIFITLYNALAYFNVTLCCRKQIQLVFAYDPKKKINIIKSPIDREEAAMLELLKPVMYYVLKVKRARTEPERERHAQDLAQLIRQAKNMMSDYDQKYMHELLEEHDIPGELDRQIDELRNRLVKKDTKAMALMESEIEHLVEHYLKRREKKFYHFHLDAAPEAPYTIVLAANPKIMQRSGKKYVRDPIMNDLDLFLRSVNNALNSFEHDEVLGQHEIWSRVRIVTIFDGAAKAPDGTARKNEELCLLNDFHVDSPPQHNVAENVIYPGTQMVANVLGLLQQNESDIGMLFQPAQIDVIFALTASPTQIRHSAYYADFNEKLDLSKEPPPSPPQPSGGTRFEYLLDPTKQKTGEIQIPPNNGPGPFPCNAFPYDCVHDYYSAIPGRVALNVLSARRHTFIHEFAHAMSSVVRGAIGDEYYDKSFLRAGNGSIFLPFFVNRIERVKRTQGQIIPAHQFVPVHPIFARYNKVDFLSDLAHPSAEENWLSYFPERHSHNEQCTMDRTSEPFRFDKLISRFMYDRLVAKLHR